MTTTSVGVLRFSAGGRHKEAARHIASALRSGDFAVFPVRGELPDACLFFDQPTLMPSELVNKVTAKQILTWLWDHRELRCMRRESLLLWGGPDPTTGVLTVGVGTSLENNERVARRAAKMYGRRAVFL